MNLDMEDFTNVDYLYAKRSREHFETGYLGEYLDLCVQVDTLLLEGIFGNSRDKCFKICETEL